MDGPTNLPASAEEWGTIATVIGSIALAIFAAWSKIFGKKQEESNPPTQDLAVVQGQFADMRPLREMSVHVVALVDATTRVAIAQEKTAVELTAVCAMLRQNAEEAEHRREQADAAELAILRRERQERDREIERRTNAGTR